MSITFGGVAATLKLCIHWHVLHTPPQAVFCFSFYSELAPYLPRLGFSHHTLGHFLVWRSLGGDMSAVALWARMLP